MLKTKVIVNRVVGGLALLWLLQFWITHPHGMIVFSLDGARTVWTCGWSDLSCTLAEAEAAQNPGLCGLLPSAPEDICYDNVIPKLTSRGSCSAIQVEHYRDQCRSSFGTRKD
ncbi:MAG TPA: hypothetical protein VE954_37480 [Oligoflexus sp.]|uniref:hypothetical protein n=1 Tax=Oligoflexus sp. TaxID=1971216 RepID=UPI002D4C2CFC|nr:hypothetical protein [Oligoflexus sp.]HYX38832.1 hypothetical protein [Oligoflexus sp.]